MEMEFGFSRKRPRDHCVPLSTVYDSITSIPLEVSPQLAAGYVTPMVSTQLAIFGLVLTPRLCKSPHLRLRQLHYSSHARAVSSSVVHLPRAIPGVPETAFADIDSLATMPNGSILIGRMFSSVLQIIIPEHRLFVHRLAAGHRNRGNRFRSRCYSAGAGLIPILLNGTGGPTDRNSSIMKRGCHGRPQIQAVIQRASSRQGANCW